jgi:phenylacetate-CoA ligase
LAFRNDYSWEFKSREEIAARSIRAIKNHIDFLKTDSSFYREYLADIDTDSITSAEDIALIPMTDRNMISENIEKFYAEKPQQIVETVLTSGSTGRQLAVVFTEVDLDRLAYSQALTFNAAGVTNKDIAQILVSLDHLSFFGMAIYRGLVTLGVNTTRVGIPSIVEQQNYLNRIKPTILVGIPSFLKKLGLKLAQEGFDVRASSVQKIFCIGESIRDDSLSMNNLGKRLQDLFNAQVFSLYSTTETSVSYGECTERNGSHSQPELVFTEIIDDSGFPIQDGTPGELVVTPLGVEGMPLLRYRTGDITFKIPESCSCGRNSDRIGPILARKSQVIKYKGKILFPRLITNALDELDFIEDYVVMLEGKEAPSAQISIHIASHPSKVDMIHTYLRKNAKVTVPVLISNVTTINSIRGNTNKKIRIIDKRLQQ